MTPGRKIIPARRILMAWLMLLCVDGLLTATARQAQEEETTRHLWNTAFINQGNKPAAARKQSKRNYPIATPKVPVVGVAADSVIGVTLWRLRPSRTTDGRRIIVQEGPETTAWLPERVSSGGRLAEGDRIRISIEAARTGYLYVVDQEQYADGSKGEPYLIFPTTRTRGGESGQAGRVVEIPAKDDSPPYFTLKRARADHVGESVIVLVSPTPIEGLAISDRAQRLSFETLALWEKAWGAQTGRLDMAGGEGRPWTSQEKEAGADSTRSLSEDEPRPRPFTTGPA